MKNKGLRSHVSEPAPAREISLAHNEKPPSNLSLSGTGRFFYSLMNFYLASAYGSET